MARADVTAQRLRELLHYDPETGVFTWRQHRGHCAAWSVAGSLDNKGYTVIRIDRAIYKAGRLAWLYTHGTWPQHQARFVDRNPANTSLVNLFDARSPPPKPRPAMSGEFLRSLVQYEPETGMFYRKRDGSLLIGDTQGPYIRLFINGRKYSAHRLAWLYMLDRWPKADTDHKDRDKRNNKWENLREATNKQNQENIIPRKGTVSGVTGVAWCKATGLWHVAIGHHKKRYFLGEFKTLDEAIEARKSGERRFFTHSPVCAPLT